MVELKFSKEHEWVRVEGSVAVVGITAFAAKALGDIVSLELPKVGASFKQGDSLAMVDSMKASSDIYSPVSGEVVEVNSSLDSSPQFVNDSPLDKGWMVKLKVGDVSGELGTLLSEAD
ncbi:glycine cleavage system protein GcvH, partial [Candidatus Micrarchaeota archaeon]|nr:glycine cleavage system protein GcvH [Candidatus Micrarchaeota archaeon]